jgi:hypothetical protein
VAAVVDGDALSGRHAGEGGHVAVVDEGGGGLPGEFGLRVTAP